jgi:iron(III) transport system permease protein
VAWNTLFLGLMTAASTTLLGTLMALMAERSLSAAMRGPLRVVALLPIITPPFVVGLGLILLFGRAGVVNQFLESRSASRPRAGSMAGSACGWRRPLPSRRSPS